LSGCSAGTARISLCTVFRAGVVDGDVKPTEARYRSVDEIAYVLLVPNIYDNELRHRG